MAVISEAAPRRRVQQGDLLEIDTYVQHTAAEESGRSNRRLDSAIVSGVAVISLVVVVQAVWLTTLVLALLRLWN